MKELSIEEKAKHYNAAIKVLHKYDGANIMFSQSLKEEMFPELKEGNDEKIRKAIRYAIGQSIHSDGTLINGVSSEEALAWLEKQDEQTIKEALRTEYEKGRADAFAEFEKQGEQKPITDLRT